MTDEEHVTVEQLEKHFDVENSFLDRILNLETPPVRAVDGVSFDISRGETFGLVGESGCGKSTVGQTILRLLEPTAGETCFEGRNIYEMGSAELERFRRNAQIVFQDPFSSLNPRMTVGEILQEPLDIHGIGTEAERREQAEEMLERVGLSADQLDRYPHEFSGGQRQRICIGRALVLEPSFIVLDEPVSALDVSVQAQILNLLNDLQEEFGLTYLFIAHDLGVVKYICDQVAVMYLGKIVEIGPTERIFDHPEHPYTEALLESIPRANLAEQHREVEGVRGDVPSPRNPPVGCRFHTRCQKVIQPDAIDIDQDAWRSIITLWHRLENSPESLEEYVLENDVEGGGKEYEHLTSELRDNFEISETLTDEDAATTVSEAVDYTVRGKFEKAAARFDEAFTTVCRAHEPELVETDHHGHQSACFLTYDEEPSISEEVNQPSPASSND